MHILNTVGGGGGGGGGGGSGGEVKFFKLRRGMCALSSESVRNLPWLGEP